MPQNTEITAKNLDDRGRYRLGIDVGGTFTDIALEHPGGVSTCKILTDHSRPEQTILAGIMAAADLAGADPGAIRQVIHGTTLITNALIERTGARTAFITTEGFRDVIEMRSENRFEQYDLDIELPQPLVHRQHRFVVPERTAADGEILLPLAEHDINRMVEAMRDGQFEAVAIGFLHSYANDCHEARMAAALRREIPGMSISLSSVVSPRMRELPRFNTVIANAYVLPLVAGYLRRLVAGLLEAGIAAPLYVMHSGGGLISSETAMEQPVRLLESGPAGGATFAAGIARSLKEDQVLGLDMGGTTAKICLIEDGTPRTADTFEIARSYRFKKGSGMLVSTPAVEMVEIGAGGGSIASIDGLGRIQVGPRSAGSEPGPACYRRGGSEPTVTDANLVLGRLEQEQFAGGAIPLDPAAARQAIADHLGAPGGLEIPEAALAVAEMVDENMANAARAHAVEIGRDLEGSTMIAFGGGGPMHACRLCEKLGISRAIVPPMAGVGSAVGFLRAPFSYEASRGLFQTIDGFDPGAVNGIVAAMASEAESFVRQGAGNAGVSARLTAFMRYSGQGWEIPVPLPYKKFTVGDIPTIIASFESEYRALFGRTIDGLGVEMANWSLEIATATPPAVHVDLAPGEKAATISRRRRIFDAARRCLVEAGEVERSCLEAGRHVDGPAIIVENETSTIVTSAFRAIGQPDGSILLVRRELEG